VWLTPGAAVNRQHFPMGYESEAVAGAIKMRGMLMGMNDEQLGTLEDFQGLLDGTVSMDFTVAEDERTNDR